MKRVLDQTLAAAMDTAMCGIMNAMQWRRRDLVCSKARLEEYLTKCESFTREDYYPLIDAPVIEPVDGWLEWPSPVTSGFVENDHLRVKVYPCAKGPTAPTAFILHALMSASDAGYQKLAQWFNDRGWNAAFPHLPFHYSRKPKGYLNGELAITADLVRNGETLRQCVVELRQLMQWFRLRGSTEFGLIGTSYGGWNAALLSFLEPDLRFLSLIQPIVNVETAIWRNPGAVSMRSLLKAQGVQPSDSIRHAHVSSPMHGTPLCGGDRVILTAGRFDTVSPPHELQALQKLWPGSKLLTVQQGHFGYAALRATMQEIEPRL